MNGSCFASTAALLAIFFVGCGPTGPETYLVQGTVTLDGVPVEKGRIAFRDTERKISSAGGPIVDGEYSFQSQPATMIVSITARREVPGKFLSPAPGEKVPLTEETIPARYNTASKLTKEVTEDKNEFHFKLESNGS